MTASDHAVLPHHRQAAIMWGRGGAHYDDVSFAISDALAHAAQRLNGRAGERILDVATGTGWTARNVARTGTVVTAVDISQELLAAARDLSGHIMPAIEFRLADAERLPFDDGAFDAVISTFGVMFAGDQAQAAAELARVCRSGGRLALATWASKGAVAEFFGVIAQHSDAPPPPSSPLVWGDPAHVEKLLGRSFELKSEPGVNNAYHGSTEDIWDWYARGFGPLRQLIESLPADGLKRLRRDVDAYHRHYAVPAGLHVKREYLVTIGRRR
jgi:ubiquinone/menaquinone biosynthesis C-methylase UbiE